MSHQTKYYGTCPKTFSSVQTKNVFSGSSKCSRSASHNHQIFWLELPWKPQPKWISKWCRQHPKCPCEHQKSWQMEPYGPIWTHSPYYKPVIHSDPFGPWSIMLDLSLARSFPGSTKSNLKKKNLELHSPSALKNMFITPHIETLAACI